jgi:hypothetical protein
MKRSHLRMVGLGKHAGFIAEVLEPHEDVLDVMRAFDVKVNAKTIIVAGRDNFLVVFLTNQRILVSGYHEALLLSDVAEISALVRGRFTCRLRDGETWLIAHTRSTAGIFGNTANNRRFYESLERVVGKWPSAGDG